MIYRCRFCITLRQKWMKSSAKFSMLRNCVRNIQSMWWYQPLSASMGNCLIILNQNFTEWQPMFLPIPSSIQLKISPFWCILHSIQFWDYRKRDFIELNSSNIELTVFRFQFCFHRNRFMAATRCQRCIEVSCPVKYTANRFPAVSLGAE